MTEKRERSVYIKLVSFPQNTAEIGNIRYINLFNILS